MHPVLLLVLLVAALMALSWYKRAPPAQRRRLRNRILIGGGIGLLLVGLLTGRLHPLFAVVGALVPLAYRVLGAMQLLQTLRSMGSSFKSARGPSAGQRSSVRTRFLDMSLDHDTGEMDGEVLAGPHRGRRLSELDLPALLELYRHLQAHDEQSRAVLEAYLDRIHGSAWRGEDAGGGAEEAPGAGSRRPAPASMTTEEAREILGVGPDATREAIIEAHRRLMQKLHPDRGGSTYLAAKINQAKDLLLQAGGAA